jgi:DNA (cytosine-5)-methyltransferase 1
LREDILQVLPTPTAVDGNTVAKSELDGNDPKHRLKVAVQVLARDSFLPTPTTQDGKNNGGPSQFDRNTPPLNTQVLMLPTTRTSMKNGATKKELEAGNPKSRLETVTDWGKYRPAIQRWEEVLDRPAPAPTKPDGKEGAHRLSSAFTEWLMGLPEGWVTDVGLTRNEELKACGNGVVPQQAATALRALLHDTPWSKIKEGRPR